MRAAAVALVLAAGCGHPAAPPAPPQRGADTANHTEPSHAAQLAHAAEQALVAEAPLDYQRPFSGGTDLRAATAKAFLAACNAGDHPSCWRALDGAAKDDKPAIWKLIETNCLAGDAMSCRALPEGESFATAPGATGRAADCDPDEPRGCNRDTLRGECTAGFARSCKQLMRIAPPDQRDPLLDRGMELSGEDCEAWIMSGCDAISRYDKSPKQQLGRDRECAVEHACIAVGRAFEDQHLLEKARDAYELTCQYGDFPEMDCNTVMLAYVQRRVPEPTPGRGQALADWLCGRAAKDAAKFLGKGEKLEDRVEACKYSKVR